MTHGDGRGRSPFAPPKGPGKQRPPTKKPLWQVLAGWAVLIGLLALYWLR